MHHLRVTKDVFCARFRDKRARTSRKHHEWSSNFELPKDLSSLMGKRYWDSPTQETSSDFNMAWWWLLERGAIVERGGVLGHGAAWWSRLAPVMSVVGCSLDESMYMILDCAFMGRIALRMIIIDAFDIGTIFKLAPDELCTLHIVRPRDWFVVPSVPLPPCEAEIYYPSIAHHGITWRQLAAGMGLLKYSFTVSWTLTTKELEDVAAELEIAAPYPVLRPQ